MIVSRWALWIDLVDGKVNDEQLFCPFTHP